MDEERRLWREMLKTMPVIDMPVYRLSHPRYPYGFYIAAPSRQAAFARAYRDDPMWRENVPVRIEQTEYTEPNVRADFVGWNSWL